MEQAKSDKAEFATASEAKADLAEDDKSFAALVASQVASKSSCAQAASDHEASVKGFAEELKVLTDARHGWS